MLKGVDRNIIKQDLKKSRFNYFVDIAEVPIKKKLIDMSYYTPGVETLIDLTTFDINGKIILRPKQSVNEGYFIEMYKSFVSIYGIEPFKKLKGMKILRNLDSGTFGDIYSILYNGNVYIIKMETKRDIYDIYTFISKVTREVDIQKLLSQEYINGVKVEPYAMPILYNKFYEFRNNNISMIVMNRLKEGFQFTISNILQVSNLPFSIFYIIQLKLIDLINTLCKINVIHGDMHWGNIYLSNLDTSKYLALSDWKVETTDIGLLDFGYSSIDICNPEIELIVLLISLIKSKFPEINKMYMRKVIKNLLKYYKIDAPYIDDKKAVFDKYNQLYLQNKLNISV